MEPDGYQLVRSHAIDEFHQFLRLKNGYNAEARKAVSISERTARVIFHWLHECDKPTQKTDKKFLKQN